MPSPIADTFGEALLGLVFASVFYGVTVLQTYVYFDSAGRKDGRWLKILVAAVFLLDTAHLGLVIHVLWHYLIDSFGHPEQLPLIVWSLLAQIALSTAIAILVQGFFAWRVALLSRTWLLSGAIVLFALLHGAFDIDFIVKIRAIGTFAGIPTLTWATSTGLACSVASDVLIAGAMWFYLVTSKSGVARSDTVVNRLVLYAVTTGTLTTVFSLATLILFALSPTFISQFFYFSLAKFYTNSLLASLNSRERMRDLFAGSTLNGVSLTGPRIGKWSVKAGPGAQGSTTIGLPSARLHVDVSHSGDELPSVWAVAEPGDKTSNASSVV